MRVGLVVFLSVQAAQLDGNSAANSAPIVAENDTVIAEHETARAVQMILPKDTPVHLMVINEVTTKTHQAGHRFKLRVNKPVVLDGRVVFPVGTIAWGEVTSADNSGNVGKSGKLAANLLYIEVEDNRYPISGGTTSKGNSGTAETVMGVLALGPLGLFAKGNNAKIKAGEMMTAFTSDDIVFPNAD
jgi:hypothetical protein